MGKPRMIGQFKPYKTNRSARYANGQRFYDSRQKKKGVEVNAKTLAEPIRMR